MKFVCSLILVEKIERSRKFYEETLKQKVKYDFGVNVTFEGDFAIHQIDHFMEVAKLGGSRNTSLGSDRFELYFETGEIYELFDELTKMNIEFLHGLEEQPWGQRVIRFYDPDRHIVEVGEAMDAVVRRFYEHGLTAAQIAERTGMHLEFVQAAIDEGE